MYYRNAHCAVVVYDITQSTSLEKARSWIRELQRQADPSIIIALCGNKSDLAARRQVSEEEAKKYAEEEGLMWGETSAKTGEGVSEIFTEIGSLSLFFRKSLLDTLICTMSQRRNCRRTLPLQAEQVLHVQAQLPVPAWTLTSRRMPKAGRTSVPAESPSVHLSSVTPIAYRLIFLVCFPLAVFYSSCSCGLDHHQFSSCSAG